MDHPIPSDKLPAPSIQYRSYGQIPLSTSDLDICNEDQTEALRHLWTAEESNPPNRGDTHLLLLLPRGMALSPAGRTWAQDGKRLPVPLSEGPYNGGNRYSSLAVAHLHPSSVPLLVCVNIVCEFACNYL